MSEAKKHNIFMDYVSMARLEYSARHIFILPGIILAYLLRGGAEASILRLVAGFAMAFCIASANYTMNEWLDRNFDRYHPSKNKRAAVRLNLNPAIVLAEWLSFLLAGLSCGWIAGGTMFTIGVLFALQGAVYNVPPLRSKDKPYIDVISESVNNPLRLAIGWAMIDPSTMPPSSIILSYWMCGAFLMAAKRLSEYRDIVSQSGKGELIKYRASFIGYSDSSLSVSCFVYGLLSSFFMAIFLIKYRIEYILMMPIITAFFARYLILAMRPGSLAQRPERLFRERWLATLALLGAVVFVTFTFVNVPFLAIFAEQRYISLPL